MLNAILFAIVFLWLSVLTLKVRYINNHFDDQAEGSSGGP